MRYGHRIKPSEYYDICDTSKPLKIKCERILNSFKLKMIF